MIDDVEDDEPGLESEELFEHHRITADPGQQLLRVDKFLMDRLPKTSRNKLQQASKAGYILANGKAIKQSYRVKPGDVITVELPRPVRVLDLKGEEIPLDIVFQDDYVAVVNKQSGLVVHPGYGNYTGTMVNGLVFLFDRLPARIDGGIPRPGLAHRLDKNTSGIMVVGKTDVALAHLSGQFFDRSTDRRYRAIVWGDVASDGTVDKHLGRSIRNRKVMDVFADPMLGKRAITHYKVLERFGFATLIECKLETGRTHQIRVHMKSMGHPLFNDPEYGGDKIIKGNPTGKFRQFIDNCFGLCPRHALHAKSLSFNHPVSEERLTFDSELPSDMSALLDRFRSL